MNETSRIMLAAKRAGVRLYLVGDAAQFASDRQPPADLLADLRTHKAAIATALILAANRAAVDGMTDAACAGDIKALLLTVDTPERWSAAQARIWIERCRQVATKGRIAAWL